MNIVRLSEYPLIQDSLTPRLCLAKTNYVKLTWAYTFKYTTRLYPGASLTKPINISFVHLFTSIVFAALSYHF